MTVRDSQPLQPQRATQPRRRGATGRPSARLRALALAAAALAGPGPAAAASGEIAVIRTAPSYATEILEGLKASLAERGVDATITTTQTVGANVEDFADTAEMVNAVLADNPDIVATIGTQASVPTWKVLQKHDVPQVFAGVTYPIKGGLIDAYDTPTGTHITGISYAIPASQRLAVMRELFPDRKRYADAAFVYSGQVLQEYQYAQNLRELDATHGWNFKFINFYDTAQDAISYDVLENQLRQAGSDLAFGWYSLDSADIPQLRQVIKATQTPFLALTSEFVNNGAVGGVLTDHAALGATQARMIDQILGGKPAGSIPPKEPTQYRIELNLAAAKRLGVNFPDAVVAQADRLVGKR